MPNSFYSRIKAEARIAQQTVELTVESPYFATFPDASAMAEAMVSHLSQFSTITGMHIWPSEHEPNASENKF